MNLMRNIDVLQHMVNKKDREIDDLRKALWALMKSKDEPSVDAMYDCLMALGHEIVQNWRGDDGNIRAYFRGVVDGTIDW